MRTIGISVPFENILETDEKFVAEVAVPGKRKKDFAINVGKEILRISFQEKKEDKTSEKSGRFTKVDFRILKRLLIYRKL